MASASEYSSRLRSPLDSASRSSGEPSPRRANLRRLLVVVGVDGLVDVEGGVALSVVVGVGGLVDVGSKRVALGIVVIGSDGLVDVPIEPVALGVVGVDGLVDVVIEPVALGVVVGVDRLIDVGSNRVALGVVGIHRLVDVDIEPVARNVVTLGGAFLMHGVHEGLPFVARGLRANCSYAAIIAGNRRGVCP